MYSNGAVCGRPVFRPMVVNNNTAAVLVTLAALARGRDQLVDPMRQHVELGRRVGGAGAERQAAERQRTGGQQVSAGAALMILEAMKMEQTLRASTAGVVEAVLVKPGDVVAPGDTLVEIKAVMSDA